MLHRCPGNDSRNLKIETIRCHVCNYEVEIFSDEFRVICPNCKSEVSQNAVPSCVEWCAAAKECVGEERLKKYPGNKK